MGLQEQKSSLLCNVNGFNIISYIIKAVGNKFSEFLVILGSGDWLMALIWSSSEVDMKW